MERILFSIVIFVALMYVKIAIKNIMQGKASKIFVAVNVLMNIEANI